MCAPKLWNTSLSQTSWPTLLKTTYSPTDSMVSELDIAVKPSYLPWPTNYMNIYKKIHKWTWSYSTSLKPLTRCRTNVCWVSYGIKECKEWHTDGSMLFCPIDCKQSSLTEKRLPGPLLYLVCRRARCLAPFFSYHSSMIFHCLFLVVVSGSLQMIAYYTDLSLLLQTVTPYKQISPTWRHGSTNGAWHSTWLNETLWLSLGKIIKCITYYKLHNEELDRVNSATYLGLELTENLSWNRHIENSCNKATKTRSFLRRNLNVNNVNAKETAYKGLVRPTSEYCCAVWDPHYKKHMHMLEMVQRRPARFVLHRYHNTSSVTDMLQQLKWDLLCQRRARIRLAMLYKIQHGLVALSLPSMIHRPIRPALAPCMLSRHHTVLQTRSNLASSLVQ